MPEMDLPPRRVDIRRTGVFPSAFDRITREPTRWSYWYERGPECSDEDWQALLDVVFELEARWV